MRSSSDRIPVAPSDRVVRESATIDGANVPSRASIETGTVIRPAEPAARIIANAPRKHAQEIAYVSAKNAVATPPLLRSSVPPRLSLHTAFQNDIPIESGAEALQPDALAGRRRLQDFIGIV